MTVFLKYNLLEEVGVVSFLHELVDLERVFLQLRDVVEEVGNVQMGYSLKILRQRSEHVELVRELVKILLVLIQKYFKVCFNSIKPLIQPLN